MGCLGPYWLLRFPLTTVTTRLQLEAGSDLILSGRGFLLVIGMRSKSTGKSRVEWEASGPGFFVQLYERFRSPIFGVCMAEP